MEILDNSAIHWKRRKRKELFAFFSFFFHLTREGTNKLFISYIWFGRGDVTEERERYLSAPSAATTHANRYIIRK